MGITLTDFWIPLNIFQGGFISESQFLYRDFQNILNISKIIAKKKDKQFIKHTLSFCDEKHQ